jgi:MFS family permease
MQCFLLTVIIIRLALVSSILVMGVPSVLIGCLPSYEVAGVAAPVLLSLLRMIQGLAMGGEFGTAVSI